MGKGNNTVRSDCIPTMWLGERLFAAVCNFYCRLLSLEMQTEAYKKLNGWINYVIEKPLMCVKQLVCHVLVVILLGMSLVFISRPMIILMSQGQTNKPVRTHCRPLPPQQSANHES